MKPCRKSLRVGILMLFLVGVGVSDPAVGQDVFPRNGAVDYGDDSYYAQADSTERSMQAMGQSAMVVDTAAVDSLAYARAEQAFLVGKYRLAESYLKDYVTRFTGGLREYEALLMLGESQIALGEEDEGAYNVGLAVDGALDGAVKAKANRVLAPIYEKRGELARAYDAYMGGVAAAEDPSTLREMYRKAVLIAGQLDAQEKLVSAAEAMIASPGMPEGLVQFARYQLAYALLKLDRLDEAYGEFKALSEGNRTEAGAECRYRMVEIQLLKGEYAKVQQLTIWAAQQDKGGHDYWVAKGYIAMARALLAQGKTLDARKTLNSLIRGYAHDGDGIRKEAEEGMQSIVLGNQSW